jgi:predicted metal-dependent HD superfamily phosphohydrolase
MKLPADILDKAREAVQQIFVNQVPVSYVFHNMQHTLRVVQAVEEIASGENLSEEDLLAVKLAAWFHDTGYSRGYEGHEKLSAEIASDFCEHQGLEATITDKVKSCILATTMPQMPSNRLEEILCDADMAHLGSGRYEEASKLLRKELNQVFNKDIGKKAWRRTNILFLQMHKYFTPYAQQNYEPVKQAHLRALREKEAASRGTDIETPVGVITNVPDSGEPDSKVEAQSNPMQPKSSQHVSSSSEKNNKGKSANARTDRGIATMFRIMSENHVSLSQMADSKANIMISVNTIVLSILVSVLLGKLQYYPQFILPTAILAGVCLAAVIFAIRATRPNVTKGVFTEEDIRLKKVNLLFFGNFFKMELKEYEWAMKEMLNDGEYLYDSMIKDIYYLGKVLAKKYHFLRISYNVFMYGLILAVLSFAIAAFVGMS